MTLLYLCLFFFTPFIFTSYNSELFEIPKMYFVYFLTIIISGYHLYNYSRGRVPFFRHTHLDIPLILFILSQAISTFFSIDIHTSIFGYYSRVNGGLLSILTFNLLYWILAIYLTPQFRNKIINWSLLSGLIVAVYGILQHFGIDQKYWVQDVVSRVFSTLGQPNWLSAYLCILLPLSLDRSLNSKTPLHKSYFILLTSILYLCLLYTKSKTGLITSTIIIFAHYIIHLKKNYFRITYYLLPITFIIFSLAIPNPIKDYFFRSPPAQQPNITSDVLNNITPSENIRQIVWQGAVELWRRYPLFGTGPETFAYSYYWTRPASHNLTSEWDFVYNKAHNEYLNFLATTGVFGFLSYLILIIFIIHHLLFIDKRFDIFLSFLAILITNLTGFSVAVVSLFFFLLPALTLAQTSFQPREATSRSRLVYHGLSVILVFYFSSKVISSYLSDIAYATAKSFDANGQYQNALQQINISLQLRPDTPDYHSTASTIYARLAMSSKSEQYINSAIYHSDRVVSISPSNTNLLKERAQVFYYLATIKGSHLATAINTLGQIATLAPTDAKTFYLLGQFLESAQEPTEAIKFYQQATLLKPNYDHAFFALGRLYFDSQRYPLAKSAFNQVLQLVPNNVDASAYLNKIPD